MRGRTLFHPRDALRQVMLEIGPDEKQRILAEKLRQPAMTSIWQKLAPMAAKFGPTIDELDKPLGELPESAATTPFLKSQNQLVGSFIGSTSQVGADP